jgi:hypothetical protein
MSRELEFYRANVLETLDRRLVYHAALAVQVAQVESREYPALELNAVPPLRRLNFQAMMLDATYPPGAVVVNKEHSGGSHISIVSGDVNITTLTRSRMPRSMKLQPYQETLARGEQILLFDDEEPESEADTLYGLLIYGGNYRSPKMTLCRMTFPTPNGEFAPGTIDMMEAYPDVLEEFDDVEHVKQLVIEFIETRRARRQA